MSRRLRYCGLSLRDWAAFLAVMAWCGFWVMPGSTRMLASLFGALS